MPLPQKKLIPGLLLALVIAALAAPPLWWSTGDPPVIDPAATENNHAPANIGQAKHMVKSALDALRPILPAVADQIEEDLVGPGKPIPSWAAPANQAEIDKNHAPLLIGQLKAIAAPFYTRLHAAAPIWLEAERIANGTNHINSIFPWTSATTDDNNKGVANIGQLKAVFSLRFEKDGDIDGMPDAWEEATGLDQDDPTDADTDFDDDGLSNLGEYENGTDPANADTDNDGATDDEEVFQGNDPKNPSNKPVAQWLVLTGDLGPEEEKYRSRTVTIPKGESRLLVVALHSEEYPGYTENFSEFDDLLTWDIRPQGEDPVTGEVHVNDRHTDWELAEQDGVEILGYGPAHIETTAKYSAPGDSDLVIEIDLSATNVSDGALPSTVMVGLLPVEVTDNLVATGVDDISKTANAGDIGYQEDFWIMAPLQGPESFGYENPTNVSIGMGSGNTGVLSCVNATPLPPSLNLNGASQPINWRGSGTGVDSEEPVKTSINGSGDSFLLPVKVKAMKHRTVNVTVYKIADDLLTETPEGIIDADLVPSEAQLETYLNGIYGKQVNMWFDVAIKEEQVETPVDHDPNGIFDYGIVDHSRDQRGIELDAIDQAGAAPAKTNITLYLLGTNKQIDNPDAVGAANPRNRTCWVKARVNNSARVDEEMDELLATIAHEFGHIVIGEGHPSDNEESIRGPAPLAGTKHIERLMWAHANKPLGTPNILVKAEWDEIEEWIQSEIDAERMNP